jgi:hypothetical protein
MCGGGVGGGGTVTVSMWDSHAPTFNKMNYPTINPPKLFVPLPDKSLTTPP